MDLFMKNYDEIADSIIKKYEHRLAERKRRNDIIMRSAALGLGTAAIVGVGICANALKPPKKPVADSSGVIIETTAATTEKTSVITSAQTRRSSLNPVQTSKTAETKASAAATSKTSIKATAKTTANSCSTEPKKTSSTAVATAKTTAQTAQKPKNTTVPQTTTAVTAKPRSIDQRIADIGEALPLFESLPNQFPVRGENGEQLPTFAMCVSGNDYDYIVSYERSSLSFEFDLNGDGKVDLCDLLEYYAYTKCSEDERNTIFPDKNVCSRIEAIPSYITFDQIYPRLLPEYMIFCGDEIPDSGTIMSQLKSYAGSRAIPEKAFTEVCSRVKEVKDKFDSKYEKNYQTLNEPKEFYDWELEIYHKLDSGELFPDCDRDGDVDYLDAYGMLVYYKDIATSLPGSSRYTDEEHEWIQSHCDIYTPSDQMLQRVDPSDVSVLLCYLFYYKEYDYVTMIEMELEYRQANQ